MFVVKASDTVSPLALLARGRDTDATAALRAAPEPPNNHLLEVMWCLIARAANDVEDLEMMHHAYEALAAHEALAPASSEFADAGSGYGHFTVGPVSR